MTKPVKHAARNLGYSLLGPDFFPIGDEELAQRTADGGGPRKWRDLKSGEIDQLQRQGNMADDWGSVLVCEPFHPAQIQRCRFLGLVRLGPLENLVLEVEGVRAPVGLYDSTLVSCDVGANVVIDRVGWLAHTIVGDEAVLHGVGHVTTTRHAVFGNGGARAGKSGEEKGRTWIEVGNETGGRAILPFDGMLPADAWLWSKYRGDTPLMERLTALTDEWVRARVGGPGHYSRIAEQAVVRDTRTMTDVRIGACARVIGASRLKNVTLLSNDKEPCQVREGAVAIDGIVGYGCRLGPGAHARRFVLGTRARLESGARVAHTVVGDNSTLAGCEAQNNLLFPFHEQHHNNSFLIAATVQGQSNIAAGATIGSNHNSRTPDGEILAGRGFWPGLCVSLKHNCRFAAYTLLVKGDYPAEIDLPLPFSLVSVAAGGLTVLPAWWLLYNMYAVQRNEWKFRQRDRRIHARQQVVTAALAPDTVEEILGALELLEQWVGAALLRKESIAGKDIALEAAQSRGREALLGNPAAVQALTLEVQGIENGRPTRIVKAAEAHAIYREIAHHDAVRALVALMERESITSAEGLRARLTLDRERRWVNLGGQLAPGEEVDRLRAAIGSGKIETWQAVHAEYDRLWQAYPEARARHAGAVALALDGTAPAKLDETRWQDWLRRALATQEKIGELVRRSRSKDFAHPFRHITCDSPAEMEAVFGRPEDDLFLKGIDEATAALRARFKPFLH
jgi:hypothetical protein